MEPAALERRAFFPTETPDHYWPLEGLCSFLHCIAPVLDNGSWARKWLCHPLPRGIRVATACGIRRWHNLVWGAWTSLYTYFDHRSSTIHLWYIPGSPELDNNMTRRQHRHTTATTNNGKPSPLSNQAVLSTPPHIQHTADFFIFERYKLCGHKLRQS